MNILFLSAWYPVPADNGSKIRVLNLLRGLACSHEIDLLAFGEASRDTRRGDLDSLCRSVCVVSGIDYKPLSLKSLLGFASPLPRWLYATRSTEMEQQLRHHLQRRDYSLIIASEWKTAIYANCFEGLPALFEDPEIGPLVTKVESAPGLLSRLRHRLPLFKLRAFLSTLLPSFTACTVVSNPELRLIQELGPRGTRIEVIPNFVDSAAYKRSEGDRTPNSLIFTGSFSFAPNYEAMVWFVREIFPSLRRCVPGVRLTITGDNKGKVFPRSEGVHLTGYVSSVSELLARSQVSVVPIRKGGGTRVKILEAMASGTAVVSTSKGAEGLDVRSEETILLADSPDAFVQAVSRLLHNPELRQGIAERAFRLVQKRYDKDAVVPLFLRLVESIGSGSP